MRQRKNRPAVVQWMIAAPTRRSPLWGLRTQVYTSGSQSGVKAKQVMGPGEGGGGDLRARQGPHTGGREGPTPRSRPPWSSPRGGRLILLTVILGNVGVSLRVDLHLVFFHRPLVAGELPIPQVLEPL